MVCTARSRKLRRLGVRDTRPNTRAADAVERNDSRVAFMVTFLPELFCSSVPYFNSSSAGPSEFGTMAITLKAGLADAMYVKIADISSTEVLNPPYRSGINSEKNPCSPKCLNVSP